MEDYLFNQHIARLEENIKNRDPSSPFDQDLNRIDARNIASLMERRIPEYGDHCEWGEGQEMFEFSDLT